MNSRGSEVMVIYCISILSIRIKSAEKLLQRTDYSPIFFVVDKATLSRVGLAFGINFSKVNSPGTVTDR